MPYFRFKEVKYSKYTLALDNVLNIVFVDIVHLDSVYRSLLQLHITFVMILYIGIVNLNANISIIIFQNS